MKQSAANLVRRLWQFCGILRDDGLSYPDYVEQLTYLLFLKMADERRGSAVPAEYSWKSFEGRDAWLRSGMEVGVDQGYRKLDALLTEPA